MSLCNDIVPKLLDIFTYEPLQQRTLIEMSHIVAIAVCRASGEGVRFICYPKFSYSDSAIEIADMIYESI